VLTRSNGLSYFNTVIYAALGIESVSDQLAYNLAYSGVAASGALAGAALSDHMPRRRILVIGTFGECSSFSSLLTPPLTGAHILHFA
jgi:MFS family permease